MRRHLVTVALLLALSVPAFGQGWSMTVWFQQTIAVQSERLARVKASQPDPPVRAYIDAMWQQQNAQTLEPELRIQGWGFECASFDLDAVDILLNGFAKDITPLVVRYPRSDVASNAGLSAWCPNWIPIYSGVDLTVPIGQLLPGQYAIRLRVWTADGQSHTTNTVWFYLS